MDLSSVGTFEQIAGRSGSLAGSNHNFPHCSQVEHRFESGKLTEEICIRFLNAKLYSRSYEQASTFDPR